MNRPTFLYVEDELETQASVNQDWYMIVGLIFLATALYPFMIAWRILWPLLKATLILAGILLVLACQTPFTLGQVIIGVYEGMRTLIIWIARALNAAPMPPDVNNPGLQ